MSKDNIYKVLFDLNKNFGEYAFPYLSYFNILAQHCNIDIKNHNSTFNSQNSTKLSKNPLLISKDDICKVLFNLNENCGQYAFPHHSYLNIVA